MSKCKLCKSFEPLTFQSYVSHLSIKHPGNLLIDVDIEFLNLNWDKLGRGYRKEVLLRESCNACSQCGFSKTRSCDSTILEMDHVDGNTHNNTKENLRILCPNCHALTTTYRNWGNKNNEKHSARIRVGNIDFQKYQQHRNTQRILKEEFNQRFIDKVHELHANKEINFSKFGWVQILSNYFDESQQVTGRRIRRLMPDFYKEYCFRRGYSKYKNFIENEAPCQTASTSAYVSM